MSSLRRNLKTTINTPTPSPVATEPPPLTRSGVVYPSQTLDDSMSEVQIDEKYFPEKVKLLFISDNKLTKNVDKIFRNLNRPIISYEYSKFHNRDIQTFEQKGINTIWVNLRAKLARTWVEQNMKKAQSWKTIVITSNVNDAWVDDIKEFAFETVDITKLKRYLDAICFEDVIDSMGQLELHKLPNKIVSVVGSLCCGSKKKA